MTDQPAFPVIQDVERFEEDLGKYVPHLVPMGGLSKRELAAFMAMQGILSNSDLSQNARGSGLTPKDCQEAISRMAIKQADALLAELGKKP